MSPWPQTFVHLEEIQGKQRPCVRGTAEAFSDPSMCQCSNMKDGGCYIHGSCSRGLCPVGLFGLFLCKTSNVLKKISIEPERGRQLYFLCGIRPTALQTSIQPEGQAKRWEEVTAEAAFHSCGFSRSCPDAALRLPSLSWVSSPELLGLMER